MNAVLANIKREPALVSGLVSAAIALAVAFGAHLTSEQTGAILAAVAAVMGIVVRQQVTPAGEVAAQQLPTGEIVSGPADGIRPDGTPVNVTQA